jgi:hypothetical protein
MLRIPAILGSAVALLGLCMFLGATSPADKLPTAPLAHFRFNGNANDEIRSNPAFRLKNTQFKENALYLNGEYETPFHVGYYAVCATPKLDYMSFTVALKFKAEEFGPDKTNLLTGGTACRWFGMNRSEAGNLAVTLNNQDFTHEIKDATLETGKWTTVACSVDVSARKVVVFLNGKKAADIDLPKDFKLRVIDTEFEDTDKQWTFTNYSNGSVFHGLVDELVIFGKALSPEQLAKIP